MKLINLNFDNFTYQKQIENRNCWNWNKTYLSCQIKGDRNDWQLVTLNLVERVLRAVFGFYKSTHFFTIHKQAIKESSRERTSLHVDKLINEFIDKYNKRKKTNFSKIQECLDLNQFINQCAPYQQAVIYGIHNCNYYDVYEWLLSKRSNAQFKDVFNYTIGYKKVKTITKDKRIITKINYDEQRPTQIYKATLVNIVLENVKKARVGLPIIPIFFFIEKDEFKLDEAKIIDRYEKKSNYVTSHEIRRAYKICSDPLMSKEVKSIAKETFCFISLRTNEANHPIIFDFTIRQAPWNTEKWKNAWTERVKSKEFFKKRSHFGNSFNIPKQFRWRDELKKNLQSDY
ncbi:MAG: hypothetical protein BGO10_08175 [Chlamydia sp. 32-24]|nr:MAG: hypothetical protein BGO10_08175 [Chlamydia sp. 32-24]